MAKLTYRSASVERATSAARIVVFDAAMSTLADGEQILSHEPPWRLVTTSVDAVVELHEVTVAIVDALPAGARFSVSAVIGPEADPGALDNHLGAVIGSLEARTHAIEAAVGAMTS